MKEHPILFSTPMVQAILQGRKTVTRRIIKPQPDDDGLHNHTKFPMSLESKLEGWHGTVAETGESKEFKFPFGWEGHKLWVRETVWVLGKWVKNGVSKSGKQKYKFVDLTLLGVYYYETDNTSILIKPSQKSGKKGWYKRPAIFAPRSSSRITLEITNVKVERLQDITEAQAIAEGINPEVTGDDLYENYAKDGYRWIKAKPSFQSLWIKINGQESWDDNPFVWAIGFNKL